MRNELAHMSRDNRQHALVPRLRFPEFRDAGDWELRPLSTALDYEQPGPFIVSSEDYGPSGMPVLTAGKTFILGYTDETDGVFDRLPVIIFDDFTTDSKFVDFPFKVKSSAMKILSGREGYSLRFIFEAMSLIRFDASQHKRYWIGVFQHLEMPFPDETEQRKIADCLGSLDDLIAAEGRKLDALQDHNKGLMQQLFPREGETQPRLRFPEWQNGDSWVEAKLGDVGAVSMCKRVFAKETNDQGGVPFYKIGTLGGEPDAYISRELYEDYRSRSNYPRVGEILITCSGTVGKCLPYDGRDAYYQDSNIVWIDNPTQAVSNEFLHRILVNVNWSTLSSTTITRIYGPDLKGLSIRFPADPAEQQKIADCLSALDARITAQTEKLDALRTHKRGLMQQLFPSPVVIEA